MDITILYRLFGFKNYHQLIKFTNLDFCDIMDKKNSVADVIFLSCKERYPQVCHPCPITGTISVNYTFLDEYCPVPKDSRLATFTSNMWEKDGEYQYQVRMFDDFDSEIFFFRYFYR